MNRSSQPEGPVRPIPPKRMWYQYLPIFKQGYEDQMARYQNDYNYWSWQQENKWNSPIEQMSRYKEAGLSPQLIYGEGSAASAGQAGSMAEAQGPNEVNDDLFGPLARFMDFKMKMSQIKNIDADTIGKLYRGKDAENMFKNLWTQQYDPTTGTMTDWSGRKVPMDLDEMPIGQRKMIEGMLKDIAEAKSSKEKAELQEKMNSWFIAQMIALMIGQGAGAAGKLAPFLK